MGHGLIQERNVNTGEFIKSEITGDKIETVYIIPSWTRNLINLSDVENLTAVMEVMRYLIKIDQIFLK